LADGFEFVAVVGVEGFEQLRAFELPDCFGWRIELEMCEP
jgi:hypothetical protein